MNNNSFSEVIDETQEVLKLAEAEIESFLAGTKKEKFGITQLSKDIAKNLNQSFTFVYQVVSMYVRKRGDIQSKRGPHGGFQRVEVKDGSQSKENAS